MKYRKAGLVLLAVAIAVAIGIYAYRDNVAMKIANRMVAGTAFVVTGLSVDQIAKDRLVLSRLSVESQDGTSYELEGATLPMGRDDDGVLNLRIERASIRLAPDHGTPGPLAPVLAAALELPRSAANVRVEAGRVNLDGKFVVNDVSWSSGERRQALRFVFNAYRVSVGGVENVDATHTIHTSVVAPDDEEIIVIDAQAGDSAAPGRVDVDLYVDAGKAMPLVADWLPLAAALGDVGAQFAGTLGIQLDEPQDGSAAISGTLQPHGMLTATYAADDDSIGIELSDVGEVAVELSYPDLDWQFATAIAKASVDTFPAFPARLQNVTCSSMSVCDLTIGIDAESVELGGMNLNRLSARLPLHIDYARELIVNTREAGEARAGSVTLPAGGEEGFGLGSLLVRGGMIFASDILKAPLVLADGTNAWRVPLELVYDATSTAWSVDIAPTVLDFDRLKPTAFVTGLPEGLDFIAGRCALDGNFKGNVEKDKLDGSLALGCVDVAGVYGEIGFTGGRALPALEFHGGAPQLAPVTVTAEYVNVGFPVTDVTAVVERVDEGTAYRFSGLSLHALGGRATAEPFTMSVDPFEGQLVLDLEGVQLPLIVKLAKLDAVKVTGAVSGELPIAIKGNTATITGGGLRGDSGGGSIRYVSATEPGTGGGPASEVDTAMRALRNFEYESLVSDVSYSESGDLVLKMRLQGINPDYDPNQPIVLNLSVEDNVRQLLKSLQAVQSIEDIIEKRVQH